MSNEQVFGLAVMVVYGAVPVAVIAFIASFHLKKWRGALITAFVAGAVAVIAFAVGESVERSIPRATKLPAEASVADQFGQNTVTAVCEAATGEGGAPTPCRVTRPGRLSGDSDRKVKHFATLSKGRLLEVSECLTRTPEADSPLCEEVYEEFFSLGTDKRGMDIDLSRITEVTFISPSGGAETVRVKQQE